MRRTSDKKSCELVRKSLPTLIAFMITMIITLVIIFASVYHPIKGAIAFRLPGNCRLLVLSPELQFVTTYVFECAGKFSTRIWPLPIENPWNEEWYKDKEWYRNWWKYHEPPQQAMLFIIQRVGSIEPTFVPANCRQDQQTFEGVYGEK